MYLYKNMDLSNIERILGELVGEVDLMRGDVDQVGRNVDLMRGDVDLMRGDVDRVGRNVDLMRGDLDLMREDLDVFKNLCMENFENILDLERRIPPYTK
jgi:hypothetical protein